MSSNRIAIFGFDYTGKMAKPWADAGYTCYCVDTQHPAGENVEGNIIKVGADIEKWMPPRGDIRFAAFFPPCTDLAVSGARWFKGKGLRRLAEAIRLFARAAELAEWCECPYMIENPVSTISTYWRKPDYSFDPSEYAGYLDDPSSEAYTKKTCLWTSSDFVMPDKNEVPAVLGSKMHLICPGDDRQNIRSETPEGFAKAVFLANHKA